MGMAVAPSIADAGHENPNPDYIRDRHEVPRGRSDGTLIAASGVGADNTVVECAGQGLEANSVSDLQEPHSSPCPGLRLSRSNH